MNSNSIALDCYLQLLHCDNVTSSYGYNHGACDQLAPVLHVLKVRKLFGETAYTRCSLLFVLQDHQVISAIASYFQRTIPEVAWNNEDQFISVLNKAGLTDQTA
eukprot:GHRR01029168.1.p1 GENE.GHRR01029168.1~~GHRR01029168.1.p1  ORF type:complete len:104 (-),score=17.06 GHRR01029168.1:5-316(-)